MAYWKSTYTMMDGLIDMDFNQFIQDPWTTLSSLNLNREFGKDFQIGRCMSPDQTSLIRKGRIVLMEEILLASDIVMMHHKKVSASQTKNYVLH